MKEKELTTYWGQFSNELLNYIKKRVKNDHDAEDILQDVFIKIYKNFEKLNDHRKLKAWMYKITNNTIIDFYRKSKDPMIQFEKVESVIANSHQLQNMNDEIISCLIQFINELPDNYREPLEMHDLKGIKHQDISKHLSISISGSKTRVHRGREKLREILSNCCKIEFDAYGNVVEYTSLGNDQKPCGE